MRVTDQFAVLKDSWLYCGQVSVSNFLLIAVALILSFGRRVRFRYSRCFGLRTLRMT